MKSKIILLLGIIFIISNYSNAQDFKDTSKVIIKRVAKSRPEEYNISEIYVKKDKENLNLSVIRVDVDVPLSTKLSLVVKDTSGVVLMYLINDNIVQMGTYRVRWEMAVCVTKNCDGFEPGRYLCVFETDQFIYQKDFFIK